MLCLGCIARTTAVGDGESDQALDGTPLVGAGAGDGIIMPIGTIHGILGTIHGVTAGVGAVDTVGGAVGTVGVEDTVGVAVGTVGVTADGIIGVDGIGGVGVVGTAGEATPMFGFITSPVIVQVLEGID